MKHFRNKSNVIKLTTFKMSTKGQEMLLNKMSKGH